MRNKELKKRMIENFDWGIWLFGFAIGWMSAIIMAIIKEHFLLKKIAESGVIEYG